LKRATLGRTCTWAAAERIAPQQIAEEPDGRFLNQLKSELKV
jgi:hypothetical protein